MKVRNQFPNKDIVTVLLCISFVHSIVDLTRLVKLGGLNREKTNKSLILARFDGYLAFEMPPFLNALS